MAKTKKDEQNVFADMIRENRQDRGLTIRDLSRRSGVSAAQISRIEAGMVTKPAWDTVQALARSLEYSPDLLFLVAGHLTPDQAVRRLRVAGERLRPGGSDHGRSVPPEEGQELAVLADDAASLDEAGRVELARRLLIALGPQHLEELLELRGVDADVEGLLAEAELREIIRAWSGLTPERRRLIRALLADQEVLSNLDRMPKPAGRYAFDVELNPRDADDVDE